MNLNIISNIYQLQTNENIVKILRNENIWNSENMTHVLLNFPIQMMCAWVDILCVENVDFFFLFKMWNEMHSCQTF